MPASMTIARVASRPKVAGSSRLMPASGPTPGSTPTSVPTTQPTKAYQRMTGDSGEGDGKHSAEDEDPALNTEQEKRERQGDRRPEDEPLERQRGECADAEDRHRMTPLGPADGRQRGRLPREHDQKSAEAQEHRRARGGAPV